MRNFVLAILFAGVCGCVSFDIDPFSTWSVDEVLPKAEMGDAIAQHRMGIAYSIGMDSLIQSDEKAFYWFHQSAKQGFADAQSRVGEMYRLGEGVLEDFSQAIYWWSQAAEQGHYGSQVNLGWIYFYGIVTEQDHSKAMHWWRRAAQESCGKEAQERLGFMYYTGTGVTKDYTLAAHWYSKAAKQAEPTSMLKLAELYGTGKGLPQSWADAFFWSSKLAIWGSYHQRDERGWAAEKYREIAASKLASSALSEARYKVENTSILNISPPDCDNVTFRQNDVSN